MCIHVERMRTEHPNHALCRRSVDEHEEQAAAVDSQPWKRNTSKRDIAEINRWRVSRDAFSGS